MTSASPSLFLALSKTLSETEGELSRMPFFVRGMVRRGFTKRSGMTFEDWQRLCRALVEADERGEGPDQLVRRYPQLKDRLRSLAEHYRTVPERAVKGMSPSASQLEEVVRVSRARQQAVLGALAYLEAPGTQAPCART